MRRVSILGCLANLTALALIGSTVVAVATPSGPEDLFGNVLNIDSSVSVSNAFISTLNLFSIASSGAYGVYAIVSHLFDSSSASSLQLIGYVLQSAVDSLSYVSLGSSFPILDLIHVQSVLGVSGDVSFQVQSIEGVPEPSSIALVVTGVAGLATLLRRRNLRRQPKD